MYRSAQRRGNPSRSRNRRIAAVATILVVFGALVTVTQVSSAKVQRPRPVAAANCGPVAPGASAPNGQDVTVTQQNGRNVRNHWGDGQKAAAGCEPNNSQQSINAVQAVNCPSVADKLPNVPAAAKSEVDRELAQLETQVADANKQLAANKGQGGQNFVNNTVLGPLKNKRTATINRIATAIDRVGPRPQNLGSLATCTVKAANTGNNGGAGNAGNGGAGNGGNAGNGGAGNLGILADRCRGGSQLQPHDGFQVGNRCVDTEMGEVGNASKNPSLLITQAPDQVRVNQAFTIRVSTRNLIRDRFLAAGQGGYYVEMSKLNAQGLTRGHFHTACRMLDSTQVAPDPAPAPAFFVATEDGGGGQQADQIEIRVAGLPQQGTAQCASWAGDGSHRVPMMERANQIGAFDAVRIKVN